MNFSKKVFYIGVVIGVLLLFLVPNRNPAHASWFEKNSFAASFFSSLWQKIILPIVTPPIINLGKDPIKSPGSDAGSENKTPGTPLTQATCIPPVPQKPGDIDQSGKYKTGTITVTPETSNVGSNNSITISGTTGIKDAIGISFRVPLGASKDDLIDWFPKDPSFVRFGKASKESDKGYGSYGWAPVKGILPPTQNYWVKIRTRYASIPERAKNNTAADGWRKIQYDFSNGALDDRGFHGVYVGREQKPSLITMIQNYSPTAHTLSGGPNFLKPFTVAPNGYFEIQTKSLGQPGTITMDIKYGKILGDAKRQVKADETALWKIQPLRVGPVLLRELSLVNTCGEDYFVDPAQTARLSELDQFKFPVVYDFEALTTQSVDLALGVRGQNPSLTAGYDEFAHLKAELSTKGDTKVPVPGIPITFRAVYKDDPKELVKNAIFKTYASEKESAGEITESTIKYRESVAMGSALVKISGKKLTAQDAKRGIIIKATAEKFPGLSSEMTMLLVVAQKEASEKDSSIKSLLITPSRQLEGLKEGDNITFKASLLMSDGSKRPASQTSWVVVGEIGSISVAGVFEAKLDDSIAEFGEGVGSVIATYKDNSGNTFTAKSAIFKVEAAIPADMGGEG